MTHRRPWSLGRSLRKQQLKRQRELRRRWARMLRTESLEDRRVMAGPDLFAIRPDEAALLQDGAVLHEAPREFNLLFKGGADIDPNSIAGNVRLIRAGADGRFDNLNTPFPESFDDVTLDLGFLGLEDPNNPLQIVMRPASSASENVVRAQAMFPDDTYRIFIEGATTTPLLNNTGEAFNNGQNFFREFRLDTGAQVVAVVPQPVSRNTQRLAFTGTVTGGNFTLTFNGQTTGLINAGGVDVRADIEAKLNALSNINANDIVVTGPASGVPFTAPWLVTFQGQYAGERPPLMVANVGGLTGTNPGVSVTQQATLSQAGNQIIVYFNNDALNPTDAADPKFYRLVDTQASSTGGDDAVTLPVSVTYDPVDNTAALTFASIPDGTYRLDIGVAEEANNLLADAIEVGRLFNTTGFQNLGYVGDDAGTSTNQADRDLYHISVAAGSRIDISAASRAALFNVDVKLFASDGVTPIGLSSSSEGAAGGTDTLTVNSIPGVGVVDLIVEVSSEGGAGGTGSYLLDIDASGAASVVSASDANTTFALATQLGTLGTAGVTHSSQIQAQSVAMPNYPGGEDEPSHRLIQPEQHLPSFGLGPTVPGAITQRAFTFPASVGGYPNFISEVEKQVVREIYETYGSYLGIQFCENSCPGGGGVTSIMKGDLKAAAPTDVSGPGGVAGRGGAGLVVLDFADFPSSNNVFGSGFFSVMYHEIGHSLGQGHAYDLPAVQGTGVPNEVFPGDDDLVHLKRNWRPDSTDIDLYQFTLAEEGHFTAEINAERRAVTSMLDSVLTLYRQNTNGTREVIARNDNYYSNDSFLSLDLTAGTYFIGVTSTGNVDYDPNIADSGFGGRTDGAYDLLLRLQSDPASSIADTDGTLFDGDADGDPGGQYSFWFESSSHTIFVDKSNDQRANIDDGNGQLTGTTGNPATGPYDTIDFAMQQAASRIIVPSDRAGRVTIQDGDTFTIDDGTNPPLTFEFEETSGGPVGLLDPLNHKSISFNRATDSPATVAAIIEARIDIEFFAAYGTANVATANGNVVTLTGITNLNMSGSPALLNAPNLVRIVGNTGLDGNISTLADDQPYLIGLDNGGAVLPDGETVEVPQGVTAMVDAGALFKLRKGNFDAGTSSALVDRRAAAIQILGTPENQVFFHSFRNDTVGGNSDGVGPAAAAGDYGGVVFRDDSDLESSGIFLNYVNHASLTHGGGKVFVGSNEETFAPIHMVVARPTVSFNTITTGAAAAMSANPNSFDDAGGRIGPDVHGNYLSGNSINGLFVRIETDFGNPLEKLDVRARFDDDDIAHVITENLLINGSAGGPLGSTARLSGRLAVDPGVVVKLGDARIEMERGASALIAEGTDQRQVIFTSTADDRFGGSGTFDTGGNGASSGTAGDWGGLMFNHVSSGSIDNALIAFAGGQVPIEGGVDQFNAIEVHQARLRLTNSTLEDNAAGSASSSRNGRGGNSASTIHLSGSQPVIVNNVFKDNAGGVLNINANALQATNVRDYGRATGSLDAFEEFGDNSGPLVRLNRLEDNNPNAMTVRGEQITTETVWDDTDIVHVLRNEIVVNTLHTFRGVRLKSTSTESLVVKLQGANAGFTANGRLLEIDDRIGGTVQVIGSAGHPVILTALADDTVGAGFTPGGAAMLDTNNDGIDGVATGAASPQAGAWRSILLDRYSNDRNVTVYDEAEEAFTDGVDANSVPTVAQKLGTLAHDEQSSDENSKLGFEVYGFISLDDPTDLDVYSFDATPGTEVWFDIDESSPALDAVIELVNISGTVLARSITNSNLSGIAQTAHDNPQFIGDFYTTNFRDPSMRLLLPGTGAKGTYFLRVRSNPQPDNAITNLDGGLSSGAYKLQIRLKQVDEFPGSTVRYADIRYANIGVDVQGMPAHSLIVAETAEIGGSSAGNPQAIGNLLETDRAAIGIAGNLTAANQRDWYQMDVEHAPGSIQSIPGVNGGGKTIAAVFDLDYSDGAVRGDDSLYVFDPAGNLRLIGRESNVEDDQGRPGIVPDTSDLSRGSLGLNDPFIGPVHLPEGAASDYRIAVSSNSMLPDPLNQYLNFTPFDAGFRLEPVNSVTRVAEDHIGFTGYTSNGAAIPPASTVPLVDITDDITLSTHVREFDLGDVILYASSANGDQLWTVNPFQGGTVTRVTDDFAPGNSVDTIQDLSIRSDGAFHAYQRRDNNNNTNLNNSITDLAGTLLTVDPGSGALTVVGNDNVPSAAATPTVTGNNPIPTLDELTYTDDVDALTFDRTGANNFDAQYDVMYSVREAGFVPGNVASFNSKLYRGDSEGANGSATRTSRFGLMGNIQPAGVTYASANAFFADTNGSGSIQIQARAPGAAGNGISVVINRANGANQVTGINAATGTITVRLDSGSGGTTNQTLQTLVDVLNRDANQWVTAAVIAGGQGAATTVTAGRTINLINGQDGSDPLGPLTGFVTGLAYDAISGGQLYGVTSGGEFISINESSGVATRIATLPGVSFQGLSLGPQNVSEFDAAGNEIPARYAGLLFAVASNGDLYALDTAGVPQPIFDSDGDDVADNTFINIGLNNLTGLAFSPIDFNLWHPTFRRGQPDTAHGIKTLFDNSRTPGDEAVTIEGETSDEGEGGASMYFGLEEFDIPGGTKYSYLGYQAANAQYGIEQNVFHSDLTIGNNNIGNNYNAPGGALGSLETSVFSLEPYASADKPTLYFNYFLQTENHAGSTINSDGNNPFRDSARAFISRDDGVTWELIATNNSTRSTDVVNDAELPQHWTDSAHEGNRFGSTVAQQQVQELFDSNNWRQARIDLSGYAGQATLKLRFDFSTAGTMNDPTEGATDSNFGEFTNGTRSIRTQNNNFEGFYIDDIIIGFSERGEMANGTVAGGTDFFAMTAPQTGDGVSPEVLTGRYQVEMRRADDFAGLTDPTAPDISIGFSLNNSLTNGPNPTYDTNERVDLGYTIVAPPGSTLTDGMTFSVIGRTTKIFEFNSSGGVTTGNVAIPFNSGMTEDQIAIQIRNAINGVADFGVLAIVHTGTSNRVDLTSAKNLSLGAAAGNATVSFAAASINESDSALLPAPATTVTVTLQAPAPAGGVNVTLNMFDPGVAVGRPNASFTTPGSSFTTIVNIPAGLTTGSANIYVTDDTVADGTQAIVVTPTVAGYTGVSATLDVLDNDVNTLTLVLPAGPAVEGTGAGTATVTRNNAILDDPLTVLIAGLDPSELQPGPDTIVAEIEANDSRATAQDLEATAKWTLLLNDDIGDTTINTSTTIPHVSVLGTGNGTFDYYSFNVETAGVRGIFDIDHTSALFNSQIFVFDPTGALIVPTGQNDDSLITRGASGSTVGTDSFLDITFPTVGTYVVAVAESGSTAAGGAVAGNPPDIGDTYTLNISVGGHASEQIYTHTVVIPAGLTSATFDLRAIEDYVADGLQSAPVSASAGGYASVVQSMQVSDSARTPVLTLNIAATLLDEVAAGSTTTTATVTTNRLSSSPQTILLTSHDTSELSVPSGVIIPANTTSAQFTITAVQDGVNDPVAALLDGTQSNLLISAHATGYPVANNSTQLISVDDAFDVNVSNRAVGAGENQQESEMQVAINPNDPLHIVAVTNNLANDNINVYRSFDGGITWARTTIVDATDGRNAATDRFGASVAFDSNGNLFVNYMTQEPTARALIVATSINGGVSFPQTATVATGNATNIKPGFVIVDNSAASAFRGNVYVTYIEAEAQDRIKIARSIDSGQTFPPAANVRVDNPAVPVVGYDHAVPAIGPTGQVYVVWEDDTTQPVAGQATIYADVSTDGATTWGTDVQIATSAIRGPIPGSYALPAQADRGIHAMPTIDVNRTNGRIYIGYTSLRPASTAADTEILLQSGTTLAAVAAAAPLTLNDDGAGASQFLPQIRVDQTTGDLYAVWYDSRFDALNQLVAVFGTVVQGNGTIVLPNRLIADGASNNSATNASRNTGVAPSGYNFGNYIGLATSTSATATDRARVLWADNSLASADMDVFTDAFSPFKETLRLDIVAPDPPVLSEDGFNGPTSLNATLSTTSATAVTVTVTFNSNIVTVNGNGTGTLVIPGVDSVTPANLTIAAVNNTTTTGIQSSVITATATGHDTARHVVSSVDDVAELNATMTVEALATEVLGIDTITETTVTLNNVQVTRSDTTASTTIQFGSSDTTEATIVGGNLTLVNTVGSGTRSVNGVNDLLVDGTRTAIITATNTAGRTYSPIYDIVDVTDVQSPPTLTVNVVAASIVEDAGPAATTGTVTLNAIRLDDLLVTLVSNDPSEALLSDPLTLTQGTRITVTIPAGSLSATFNVDAVNEFTNDAARTVRVTGFADGYASNFDTLTVNPDAGGGSVIESYNRLGDSNRFRDQGQLLIENNTISNAATYGIEVSPGARDVGGNRTYPGAIINFAQVNNDNIAPGVVIQNNIVVASETGSGIHFAGEPNNPPSAMTPFGRIVNNTIFGGTPATVTSSAADVIFLQDTTFSMGPFIDGIVQRIGLMDTAMQAAGINVRYGAIRMPESSAIFGGSDEPIQIQDITNFATFSAPNAPYPQLVNDTGGGREAGSEAVLEALNLFDPQTAATTFNYTPGARLVTVVITWDPLESTCRHASLSIL